MMSFEAKVFKSKIFEEVIVFKPSVGRDLRGTIFTTYDNKIYDQFLPKGTNYIHDKFAESKFNVLRGLHGDSKTWKLVSCINGEIYQVAVDMRPESATYLKWDSWVLNDKNKLQVLIPPGFVNGYYVMSEVATFHYKLAYEGVYFDVADQQVVKWDDDRLKIHWPCEKPILNDRDR